METQKFGQQLCKLSSEKLNRNSCLNRSFYTCLELIVVAARHYMPDDLTEYGSIASEFSTNLPRRGEICMEGSKKGMQMFFHPTRKQSTLNNWQSVSLTLRAVKEIIGKANDQATEQFDNWLKMDGHVNITFVEQSKCSESKENFNKRTNEHGIKRQARAWNKVKQTKSRKAEIECLRRKTLRNLMKALLTNTSFCTEQDALEILEQLERKYKSKWMSALSTKTYNRYTIGDEEVEAIF